MKRLFLFLCLIAAVSVSFAQTQQGYVKTRGRLAANGTVIPGTRLSGATLTFKGNKTVVSGNNGVFTFSVPSKTYCVTNVQKNGYQLYDRDLLGRTHNYSTNDLLVVMDTPDNVLADKLTSERKIRRTLQRQLVEKEDEIEALKEQQKITEEQYRKQLQELYKAQENNEKLISEMAERYSTLDFDQLDDFQRRVAAYIQNGELTRADSLLNTKGSMEERSTELDRDKAVIGANAEALKKRQEEQAQSEALYAKKLEDFAADCYSRYEICKLREEYDSAAYWLELRANKDTLNVNWQLVAGLYIHIHHYGTTNYSTAALRYFNRALHSALSRLGEMNEDVAKCYSCIGHVYSSIGNYSEALTLHQKALKIQIDIYGENHPNVAEAYNEIGHVYSSIGNYSEALTLHQKALKIQIDIYGENHPNVAEAYNEIGDVYSYQGDYSKAIEMHQNALIIRMKIYGESHPYVAYSYNCLADIYETKCDYSKAVEMHQKALKITLEFYGDNHSETAQSYNLIGYAYSNQGNYSKALEMYQKALNIQFKIYGENHRDVAECYGHIGSAYSALCDYPKALEMLQQELKILLRIGENDLYLASKYEYVGLVYSIYGDYQKTLEMYEKALKIKLEKYGENNEYVANSYEKIGEAYFDQGDYTNALEMYQKALKIRSEVLDKNRPEVENSFFDITNCYWTAKSKGIELPGFKEFTCSRVFIATTVDCDTSASKAGMCGECVVLEFADWTIDTESSLWAKNEEKRGKPKAIVVMKDGVISQYQFENTIGVHLGYKYVGEQEKQRILKAYKEWKEKR